MADSSYTQPSFLGGEFSPFSQGRIDLPSYRIGMNVCRNGLPIEEGAWVRRSGTRFKMASYLGGKARVMPFAFEEAFPYMLEFSNLNIRAFAVTNGDFALVTSTNATVANISTANPAVVQISGSFGASTGDQVMFTQSGVVGNFCPALWNRCFTITVVDSTHFSLADAVTGQNIDGSTLGWSAPSGTVTMRLVSRYLTVYAASEIDAVRLVQAETEAFLLHGNHQPYLLSVLTEPTSTSFATFNLVGQYFNDGPYMDPDTSGATIAISSLTLVDSQAPTYTAVLTFSSISSVNGGAGFTSADIQRRIRVLSEPAAWASATAYTVGESVLFNGAYFTCIASSTGNQPDISPTYWTLSTTAAVWFWCFITAVSADNIVTVFINGSVPYPSNTVHTWRLGLYSNASGWPTCGVYYEGRLCLAGAVPNRIDMSKSNDLTNFSPTDPYGNVLDDSGISYIFNSDQVNPIYWLIGQETGIIAGTLGGEWVISGPTAGPITPTNIAAHKVTQYGCANIEPARTDLTVSFVHKYQRKVLEYFPDVFTGRYTAPNLSQTAKHLTTSGIEEIRYQRELAPVIWARCGNGSLIGATYKRTSLFSSQGPEFVGWHHHDMGSGRTVESIAIGPSADGTLDNLWMVTYDGSIRHVEVMNELFDVDQPLLEAWLVDDSVVPSGGTIAVSSGTAYLALGGLTHLNGKTVQVFCGGVDCGDFSVSGSQVSVPIDADPSGLFTTAYLSSISGSYGNLSVSVFDQRTNLSYTVPCVIGFTYTSQGQILRPDTQEQGRTPTGPGPAKIRRNHQFGAMLAGAQGVQFGTDFATMHAAQFMSSGGTKALTALQLFTGVYWDAIEDTYSFDGMLAWQITRPVPCALVSITGFANMSDR